MEIRNVFEFVREEMGVSFDTDSAKDLLEHLSCEDEDFEIDLDGGTYRFIHEGVIDDILVEELKSDRYALGCFASWAIADATGWPIPLISALQENDGFQLLGEAMTEEHIEKLADGYISNDGYGHHFGHYDFGEYEAEGYYIFRVN